MVSLSSYSFYDAPPNSHLISTPTVCKDYGAVKSYLTEQVKDGLRNILPLDD